MQKLFDGPVPQNYKALLRITGKAALVRVAALVPFVIAYSQPFSPWLRLIALLTPVLWALWVCPARLRYAAAMADAAQGKVAVLSLRSLSQKDRPWIAACKTRARLLWRRALPLCALGLLMVVLLWFVNAFTALKVLMNVFGGLATVVGTMAAFIPRLLMGEAAVQPAGVAGGIAALAVVGVLSLALFGWSVFQTSPGRFGYTGGIPKAGALAPLLKKNLRLWLPTLALLLISLIFTYREIGLLFANLMSAAPVFAVKLRWHQITLLVLTAASYFALLPARKRNTALWAIQAGQTGTRDEGRGTNEE